MPLCPHINDYPVTSTCTSSAHYNVVTAALQNVVLQAIPKPSPFHSPAPIAFSIWMWREGLETLREPIWEFTRVNEIAEHILILTHEQDHYGTYSLGQTFRK